MAMLAHNLITEAFGKLRYEPTMKRIRAKRNGETLVDTTRAVLLWQPHHVVSAYAVPESDLVGAYEPGDDRPRLHDSVLADYVVLDFDQFDAWFEEDDAIMAHPHDPFHRIDIRRSSRHVRVERDGELLAESSRPTILFETLMPPRFSVPADDILAELRPTETVTWCAYKGRAAYYSVVVGNGVVHDLAWTIPEPLVEGEGLEGLVSFFNDQVDITLDGELLATPTNPWSTHD